MILTGNALDMLSSVADEAIQTCVTSPPYWGLRDYGAEGQIGLEPSPYEYIEHLTAIFEAVRRVLRPDGTLWLNLGDSYATGGGRVGDAPGGQSQGDTFKEAWRSGYKGRAVGDEFKNYRPVTQGWTQPNRMPIAGLKAKDLIGIPWRVAFALQAAGWYLRSDIIWHKPNPMPESVRDRPTKSHEYLFLLTKQSRYYYDAEAVKEPCQSGPSDIRKMIEQRERIGGKHKRLDDRLVGASRYSNIGHKRSVGDPSGRNRRSVWSIATQPYRGAHFATFPPKLIEPCILAGSRPGDVVLDPFAGAGTTGLVAAQLGRAFLGIELNPAYVELAEERLAA